MQYKHITAINKTYQHVYVSPHLDDISFSCSGLIAGQVKAGEKVLVMTVFTADAGAGKKPRDPALRNVVDLPRRRMEDQKAMDAMAVDYLWLDHEDWIFRHRHPLCRYSLSPVLLKGERELTDLIASEIKAVCKRVGNRSLYLPLGIGQHADHQLVFRSGLQLRDQGLTDMQMLFYEEIPYALFPNLLYYRFMALGLDPRQRGEPDLIKPMAVMPATRAFIHSLRDVPSLLGNKAWIRWLAYGAVWSFQVYIRFGMRPRRNCLQAQDLIPQRTTIGSDMQKKFKAILCYQSQVTQIRNYPEKMERMLQAYSRNLGSGTGMFLERCWVLAEKRRAFYCMA